MSWCWDRADEVLIGEPMRHHFPCRCPGSASDAVRHGRGVARLAQFQ
jgi:hypothetical protein